MEGHYETECHGENADSYTMERGEEIVIGKFEK